MNINKDAVMTLKQWPHAIACVMLAGTIGAAQAQEEGFTPLFNGRDLTGWVYGRRGDAENRTGKGYQVENGVLFTTKEDGGNLFTEREYGDFVLRFEFRLTENANNGIGIRAPLAGDAAYAGIEIQVLDDTGSQYTKLRPAQYHGSVYHMFPARRGFQKPVGEWNSEEITVKGRQITITLNGTTIVDANLDDVKDEALLARHRDLTKPEGSRGIANTKGHIGLLGHGTRVEFRNIRIRDLAAPAAPAEQHGAHGGGAADSIGSASVDFQTSCAPALQGDINRAVALLHSFWFAEAIAAFDRVAASDPSCGIAHWGVAVSQWGNPFAGLRAPQQIELGRAAILKARAAGARTARERAYIDAAAALFTDGTPATQRARTVAYAEAMGRLTSEFPDDTEARIFYALAVNQTAQASDKTYTQQLKAAAILEPLFAQYPSHPGLAHYIIHAYDHPPLAPKALEAARRYASLAPAVPHALHMPSHTFTRVGFWKESIETNRKSAEAARRSSTAGEELHALDYQAYAYLQIAQDKAAQTVLARAETLAAGADGIAVGAAGAGAFAVAAIPARYALERAAWSEAAVLPVRPATPYTEAMTHFARALGAARSGNPKAAMADIGRLTTLRESLTSMQDAYWSEQVDIQRRVAQAWVTFAEGRKDEGIAQLRAAADAEDATDKSAVSPGPLAPARELLGYMLLEAGRGTEALGAFEESIRKEPNRFRGLYGAGRAAERAGDRQKATALYAQLLKVAAEADTERPELRAARTFLGGTPSQ